MDRLQFNNAACKLQNCNDSNYSFSEASDFEYVDDKAEAKREAEQQALIQLEKAQVFVPHSPEWRETEWASFVSLQTVESGCFCCAHERFV